MSKTFINPLVVSQECFAFLLSSKMFLISDDSQETGFPVLSKLLMQFVDGVEYAKPENDGNRSGRREMFKYLPINSV